MSLFRRRLDEAITAFMRLKSSDGLCLPVSEESTSELQAAVASLKPPSHAQLEHMQDGVVQVCVCACLNAGFAAAGVPGPCAVCRMRACCKNADAFSLIVTHRRIVQQFNVLTYAFVRKYLTRRGEEGVTAFLEDCCTLRECGTMSSDPE